MQPSAGQYVLHRVGIGLEQMNLLRANEISMQMRCTHSESTKNGLSLSCSISQEIAMKVCPIISPLYTYIRALSDFGHSSWHSSSGSSSIASFICIMTSHINQLLMKRVLHNDDFNLAAEDETKTLCHKHDQM